MEKGGGVNRNRPSVALSDLWVPLFQQQCYSYFQAQTQLQYVWLQMVIICTQCLPFFPLCEPSPLTSDKGMGCSEIPNILWAHIRGGSCLCRSHTRTNAQAKATCKMTSSNGRSHINGMKSGTVFKNFTIHHQQSDCHPDANCKIL